MKKTFLIFICVFNCFRVTSQTGALYCDYGDNKDHLTVCLVLFQDRYRLEITDMCVDDLPSDLFISTGCCSETSLENYILTDTYGNKLALSREGPLPILAFDHQAPAYLRNRRLFYYGESEPYPKCQESDNVYSYFTKKEIKEYRIQNKKKYNLSDGTLSFHTRYRLGGDSSKGQLHSTSRMLSL